MLPEGNKLKDNFYTTKSIMKPFGLEYQKNWLCLNFCMLYSDKYANFNECETYQHARYKPNNEYWVTQSTKLKGPNFHITVNTYVNELNVIMSTSGHKKVDEDDEIDFEFNEKDGVGDDD